MPSAESTSCGDASDPTYQPRPNAYESPTRQCGDRSDPAYQPRPSQTLMNPPHGSVGIVQILPTSRDQTLMNPHTAVWGCSDPAYQPRPNAYESPTRQCGDCSDPTYQKRHSQKPRIPPTGSGWMVQIRPPLHTDTTYSVVLSHALSNAVVNSPQVPA